MHASTAAIPTCGKPRRRDEDGAFEGSQGYRVRLCLQVGRKAGYRHILLQSPLLGILGQEDDLNLGV